MRRAEAVVLSPRLLARGVAIAVYAALAGGAWDFWWHATRTRDSFWSPPHLLIQAAIVVALTASAAGWGRTRTRRWATMTLACAAIPIAAPLDNLWHRLMGQEYVSTVLILWSPPHLVPLIALTIVLAALQGILREEPDAVARTFFVTLTSASLLYLWMYYAFPLEPFGPYRVLGFAGTAPLAFLAAGSFLRARRLLRATGSAVLTAVFYLVLAGMQFSPEPGPAVDPFVPPFAFPPGWLWVFAVLLAAAVVDLVDDRLPGSLRGAVAGLLYTGVVYAFASPLLDAPFRYGAGDAVIAGAFGALGGGAAGIAVGTLLGETRMTPVAREGPAPAPDAAGLF